MKILILLSAVVLTLGSCKKNYTCECSGPGGTDKVFTTKDTRKNAKKLCDDYYDSHWGNVPMSETGCEIK